MNVAEAPPTARLIDCSAFFDREARWLSFLAGPVERALFIHRLNGCYADFLSRVANRETDPPQVFDLALASMGIVGAAQDADLKRIPASGPLVVVGNHPFGGVEGVLLAALLLKVRKDIRVLGNYLLKRIAGISDFIIPVDPFAGGAKAAANLKGVREAVGWLKNGGALLTFPAGEVASFRIKQGRVADPAWSPHIGGIIRRSRATALPVYIPGRNSLAFQLLGMIHPRLRTALLPRELVNKSGKQFRAVIGQPVSWPKLSRFSSDADRIEYLRFATCLMKNRRKPDCGSAAALSQFIQRRCRKPLVAAADPGRLAAEVAALPGDSLLARHGDMSVRIARPVQIPLLLKEIGRLREKTFREVGEGTGGAIDLDRFDRTYHHLFLWNEARQELVGAYRLGLTDRILAEEGPSGLYTSRLFRFKPEFVDRLGAAIEFGRSFIRSEYQRQFSSLMLLWKGIGAFVARHPRYHLLFGAVSISSDYQGVSRSLIVRFLKEKRLDPALSKLVAPKKPFRMRRIVGIREHLLEASFQDLDDVSLLVSAVETDGKGIPVLLRQYLKLNGRLLCFNVDRSFSDVVDGLLLVDLRQTEPRLMRRFMGEDGYRRFAARHGTNSEARLAGEAPERWRETA